MAAETPSAVTALADELIGRHPDRAAAELEAVPADRLVAFLSRQPPEAAVALLEELRPDLAAGIISDLEAVRRTAWLETADPDRSVLVLGLLDDATRTEILAGVDPRIARELTEILTFPPSTAGAIMDRKVRHFRVHTTVEEALTELRRLRHLRISNLHLVDADGVFAGSVRLQDLAVSEPEERLGSLMAAPPVSVRSMASTSEVVELMEQHDLVTIPVVDFEGRLSGVIRHEALMSAVETEATADIQAMVGASRDERALSPVSFAVKKRLPWLQINLLTAFLASFVVGLFEDTIARLTALAVLLPVVAGQSGNTGAQALAVTMRGLALREIRVRHAARVALKETAVGAVNGVAVAAVTAGAVWFWSRSAGLAGVIGVAMVISMLIAGLAGATIPVMLTVLGQDPAQASSIVLTTVTDVVGFLSFLGLATVFMSLM